MSVTHRNHAINYIELPCIHPEAIKRFYNSVFGWNFVDYGPNYIAFNDGVMDGGFTTDEPVVSIGGPRIILYSANLENSMQAVKDAGGTINKEIFSFPGGRRFHFIDPDGNHLAVWSE